MRSNSLTRWLTALIAVVFVVAIAGLTYAQDDNGSSDSSATAKPMGNMGQMKTMDHPMKSKSAMKGLLDGKSFVGQMGDEGQSTGGKDVITFRKGMFHSSHCDAMGFKPSTYTATQNGDEIDFTAECLSQTNGKMDWSGKVMGDKLDAKATNVKEGKDPVQMWATATMEAHHSGKSAHMMKQGSTSASKSTGK